jgi:hypothetical protein
MPRVGFEPTIPAFERAKTVHALDRAATLMPFYKLTGRFKSEYSRQYERKFWGNCLLGLSVHLRTLYRSADGLFPVDVITYSVNGPLAIFPLLINLIGMCSSRPPLWSSGQSFWLQTQRYRVPFPALQDFLRSRGSGTGSSQPREDN